VHTIAPPLKRKEKKDLNLYNFRIYCNLGFPSSLPANFFITPSPETARVKKSGAGREVIDGKASDMF
jgi:hypothetical protein